MICKQGNTDRPRSKNWVRVVHKELDKALSPSGLTRPNAFGKRAENSTRDLYLRYVVVLLHHSD